MESLINMQEETYNRITRAYTYLKQLSKYRIDRVCGKVRLDNLERMWDQFTEGHTKLYEQYDPDKLKQSHYVKTDMYNLAQEIYIKYRTELETILGSFQIKVDGKTVPDLQKKHSTDYTSELLSQFNVQLYTKGTSASAISTRPSVKILQSGGNKEISSQKYSNQKVTQVVCMKCKAEVEPTEAAMISQGGAKAVIAKLYHFLEREHKELKEKYRDLDLTHLLKFRQRTAEATGVSENIVDRILKEEKGRDMTQSEPPEKRRKVNQDDSEIISLHSSCEDFSSLGKNDVNSGQTGNQNDSEVDSNPETLVMKIEISDDEIDMNYAEVKPDTPTVTVEDSDQEVQKKASFLQNARLLPAASSLSSGLQSPDPPSTERVVAWTAAVPSSSRNEYSSPPTSPPPARRPGRGRPRKYFGTPCQPAPNSIPTADGNSTRMRWTQSINENVMRAYYAATEGGTNLDAYRGRMLSLFQVLEPTLNVSAQRLSTQVRVIQHNHRLDKIVLDRLRKEVQRSRGIPALSETAVHLEAIVNPLQHSRTEKEDDRRQADDRRQEDDKAIDRLPRGHKVIPTTSTTTDIIETEDNNDELPKPPANSKVENKIKIEPDDDEYSEKARLAQNARAPSSSSSLSSTSESSDVASNKNAESSSSDEYSSPPTSPTPPRRRGRPRKHFGPRTSAPNRVRAADGNSSRIRWTQSMNENVMRAYYTATAAETNFEAYRGRLLSLFQELEPTINVSAQRLSDQVRLIHRYHRLDDIVLYRLRSEVQFSSGIPIYWEALVNRLQHNDTEKQDDRATNRLTQGEATPEVLIKTEDDTYDFREPEARSDASTVGDKVKIEPDDDEYNEKARFPQHAHTAPSASVSSSQAQEPASTKISVYFPPATATVPRPGRGRPRKYFPPQPKPAWQGVRRETLPRMRWTRSINENVMCAYYGATEGGTNFTGYRRRLLALFKLLEPGINVSAQRLADQVRAIKCRDGLDDIVFNRIPTRLTRIT